VLRAAREPADRELPDPPGGALTDRPTIAVVVFPGSNDDHDAAWALGSMGAAPVLVWHGESELPPETGAVVLPGGFSYGDYLRAGAIASTAPVMDAVRRFADAGGPILGICNGFQTLCEARLLPGALRPNRQLEFVCRDVIVSVENADSLFTRRCVAGQELTIPVKHGDGAWYADEGTFVQVVARRQVVLRYRDDVNGSLGNVAGIVNERGNVMGLMPHPEHAVDPLLGSADGGLLLAALVDAAGAHAALATAAPVSA
jgi:phosphoribosylformylglycinamidine synthase